MIARVKKDDTVQILSGKNRGKQGTVMTILPKKKKVMVKGIAIATHHIKPRRAGEAGSVRKEESFIDISCVMPICSACRKPARVNSKKLETGKSVRVCNRCKEIF